MEDLNYTDNPIKTLPKKIYIDNKQMTVGNKQMKRCPVSVVRVK